MNPKYQKVCAEIAKTEKKVEDLQGQLKELYDKKTELDGIAAVQHHIVAHIDAHMGHARRVISADKEDEIPRLHIGATRSMRSI